MGFLCKWFGIGCPPKPPVEPPTQPPPPTEKPVAVVVFSNDRPVIGARVKLDGDPHEWPLTNGDGYTLDNHVPASLTASHLFITCEGYEDYDAHVDLVAGEQTLRATLKSSGVDPSTFSLDQLARIRGAMWTVRGPWRFGPRPGSPDNITALEYIYSYGDNPTASPLKTGLNAEQRAMLDAYKSHAYTHLCFGPINAQSYHGQYPDYDFTSPEMFEVWLDWLQVFWNEGLAPVCFLHGDGQNLDQTRAMYDHLIMHNPRAQKLMRIIVPSGWEPAKYEWSSQTWANFAAWGRSVLPNALVLIHTVTDVDAPVGTDENGDDNGKPNAEGWHRVCPHIHGWLAQSAAFENPDAHGDPNHPDKTNFDNWADLFDKNKSGSYYDRFHHGYAGWPTTSAWGNVPIKIYAGEYCAYWSYWNNRPYEEGVKWGNRAMSVGADGYLDAGSVPV